MKSLCGFCLAFLLFACKQGPYQSSQWDGTYIGYYHQNMQDTLPLTLVFEGQNFAAAPYGAEPSSDAAGVFHADQSALVFENMENQGPLPLNGAYRYQFSPDGSVRFWQQNGDEIKELILVQK